MSPAQQRIIDALKYRPRRSCEVASAANIAPGYARDALKALYDQKQVYVCDWVKVHKVWVRVYAAGAGKDKPKPRPLDKIEIMHRYNSKWRTLTRLRQRKQITPWTGLGGVL